MVRNRVTGMRLRVIPVLCFSLFISAPPVVVCQIAQLPEKPQQDEHKHPMGMSMDMNVHSGVTDKCEPKFTYNEGPGGPSHWAGLCTTGQMQTPIDITQSEKVPVPLLPPLEFSYEPVQLDIVNDCNSYEIKLRFPDNKGLKVARKPYRLSEIVFHEPGETAVYGKRPPMSLQLIHLSPEANFLIVEVPVVVGKENPVIKTLWEHIPKGGKENKVAGVRINAMDLLPADHGFYRFPGSLTTPICNEAVQWYLMKSPIEMSAAQIARYKKYYHNTARPLQSLHNRPVAESK
jgi:carbonic anhydrase